MKGSQSSILLVFKVMHRQSWQSRCIMLYYDTTASCFQCCPNADAHIEFRSQLTQQDNQFGFTIPTWVYRRTHPTDGSHTPATVPIAFSLGMAPENQIQETVILVYCVPSNPQNKYTSSSGPRPGLGHHMDWSLVAAGFPHVTFTTKRHERNCLTITGPDRLSLLVYFWLHGIFLTTKPNYR